MDRHLTEGSMGAALAVLQLAGDRIPEPDRRAFYDGVREIVGQAFLLRDRRREHDHARLHPL